MSFFVACCASAGVSFAVFTLIFTNDVKKHLKAVNKKVKSKDKLDLRALADFCDAIEMHGMVEKLSIAVL